MAHRLLWLSPERRRKKRRKDRRSHTLCQKEEQKGSHQNGKEFLMQRDADLEQELDTRTYALQRDLLLLRLARLHHLPTQEKQARCLEQLTQLRALLTEIEASVSGQPGCPSPAC
jgi:hypothetical protein